MGTLEVTLPTILIVWGENIPQVHPMFLQSESWLTGIQTFPDDSEWALTLGFVLQGLQGRILELSTCSRLCLGQMTVTSCSKAQEVQFCKRSPRAEGCQDAAEFPGPQFLPLLSWEQRSNFSG